MTDDYPSGPAAGEDPLLWVEVLGLGIRVGARAAFGDAVQASVEWGGPEPAGWQGGPGGRALTLSFRLRDAEGTLATYFLAPWQRLSGTERPLGGLVPLVTVTSHALVFGPLAGTDAAETTRSVAEKLAGVVAAAVDLEHNEEVSWHKLDGPLPAGLAVDDVSVRAHYAILEGRLAGGRTLDEDGLSRLAPGRMLGLALAQESGAVTRLWVPPAPYEPPPRAHDPWEQRMDDATMDALPGLYAEMNRQVQNIFSRTLEEALLETGEGRRRLLFFEQAEELRAAIFGYPFHSGPAFAAGANAFDRACREFVRLLALPEEIAEEKLAPAPSVLLEEAIGRGLGLTPEGAALYLSAYGQSLVSRIDRLPPPSVDNLPALLIAYGEHQRLAGEAPGEWRQGDASLSEYPRQYYPSEKELLVSIIGGFVRHALETASEGEVARVLERAGVTDVVVEYSAVDLRQVYVEGRGNLFHAEPPQPTRVQLA